MRDMTPTALFPRKLHIKQHPKMHLNESIFFTAAILLCNNGINAENDRVKEEQAINSTALQIKNLDLVLKPPQNENKSHNSYDDEDEHEHEHEHMMPPLSDSINDGIFEPFSKDASCDEIGEDCDGWSLPESTIESEEIESNEECDFSEFARATYGGTDPDAGTDDDSMEQTKEEEELSSSCRQKEVVDKHWGRDEKVIKLRDALKKAGQIGGKQVRKGKRIRASHEIDNRRPPIFLMPGLASTRLVNWNHKTCQHPLISDIKMQDYVWLNVKQLIEMAGIDPSCWQECMSLGKHQRDHGGCRLRPDEGLDAIASLAPGSLGSDLLVGGTNTVYAWLIQWLAENLGYDVSSIVGLPYDWRLSPDVMEERDGYLTLTKHRIEAAVAANGGLPGIMVAHSMGNLVFRYFLQWLRQEFIDSAFERYSESLKLDGALKFPGWLSNVALRADEMRAKLTSMARDFNLKFDGNKLFPRDSEEDSSSEEVDAIVWELAKMEGTAAYHDWVSRHIWTYVGLSAPLLGASSPLRSVISGETMGLPMSDELARDLEITFGSTHTANAVSTKMAFCDNGYNITPSENLACLDEVVEDIEDGLSMDPWKNFDTLRLLMKERVDWDSAMSIFRIDRERCEKGEKSPCAYQTTESIGPREVQNGEIFDRFSRVWSEKDAPLMGKKDQLRESWWDTPFGHILNTTWDRPHIKHVVMAYGTDRPTEVGYFYKKKEEIPAAAVVAENKYDEEEEADIDNNNEDDESDADNGMSDLRNSNATAAENFEYDGMPHLKTVIWEVENGEYVTEAYDDRSSSMFKRKPKKEVLENVRSKLPHSGDGTIPYLSMAWAHTWLLHATRAYMRRVPSTGEWVNDADFDHSNALKNVKISHRPSGGSEWIKGPIKELGDGDSSMCQNDDCDTGTSHPHGTKYKPEMLRYQSKGRSRTNGMEYTTMVIEGIGVEHKETTRFVRGFDSIFL